MARRFQRTKVSYLNFLYKSWEKVVLVRHNQHGRVHRHSQNQYILIVQDFRVLDLVPCTHIMTSLHGMDTYFMVDILQNLAKKNDRLRCSNATKDDKTRLKIHMIRRSHKIKPFTHLFKGLATLLVGRTHYLYVTSQKRATSFGGTPGCVT